MLGRPGAGIFIFLVVLLIVMGFWSPVILGTGNLIGILNQMVFILIPTFGLTLVIIAGGLDLSVGSVLGLTGGIAAYLIAHGTSMPVAFAGAILCGAAIGLVNGLVITRLRVPDFVATLAMLGVVRGALYVWTHAVPIRNYMSKPYFVIGGLRMVLWKVSVPLMVALVLLLILAFILRRTHYGVHLRATGSNPDAAKLSGINPDQVKVVTYIASGVLAAITGILLAGRLTTVHPDMGSGYELNAIAAAVMGGAALSGGRGSFYGALIGAVTLTVIQNAINILNIDPNWEHVIIGAIILFAVLIDRGALALAGRQASAH
ncbi:MAG TPA: ABC transporter permease [Chthoniobacterales bacterium]